MLVYIVTTNNTSTRIRSVSRGESSMPCTEKARLVNRTKAALPGRRCGRLHFLCTMQERITVYDSPRWKVHHLRVYLRNRGIKHSLNRQDELVPLVFVAHAWNTPVIVSRAETRKSLILLVPSFHILAQDACLRLTSSVHHCQATWSFLRVG